MRTTLFCTLLMVSLLPTAFSQGYDRETTKSEDFDDWKLEQQRTDYWYHRRTDGSPIKNLGELEKVSFDAMRSMENRTMFKSLGSAAWVPVAGSVEGHNSGRIRAIAVDPNNTKIVYVGAASGGVWKTNDITAEPVQWVNLTGNLPTVNFGALAVDPQNPDIIYAGTGESEGDNYREPAGSGIFKSTDGGLNWTNVAPTSIAGTVCSQILIDETNSQRVYIATGSSSGLLKTENGGTDWKKVSVGVNPLSITYSALEPNKLYVSGIGSGYRSTDFGDTWTKCAGGFPTGSRMTMACAPTAANVVYVAVGNAQTTKGVWFSSDYGVNWRAMFQYSTGQPNPLGQQAFWCNAFAVRPNYPYQLVFGGLDIYSSVDTGKNWKQVTQWNPPLHSYPQNYVHADIHTLMYVGTGTLYACTDGGLARATAPFQNWNTAINRGLATMQFVGGDADEDFNYVTGGTQDNGTLRASLGDQEFTLTHGGDGGRGWVASDDSNIVYTTYVNATFFKSLDAGRSYSANLIQDGSDLAKENAPFYPSYDVSTDGTIVAFGANSHVWVSSSGGSDGFPKDHRSNVTISSAGAVHVSQQNGDYMWAGSGTKVFRSTDQGYTWLSTSIAGSVTGITSKKSDKNILFVVTGGTGGTNKHFYTSNDGGVTFTSPATNLPDIPMYTVAYNDKDGKIFIGNEKGVLYSEDQGVTWNPVMNGLPPVLVNMLRIKQNGNTLIAFTYGRGVFSLDLKTLSAPESASASGIEFSGITPNPISGNSATIAFTIPKAGQVEIKLFDVLGREVKILEKKYYDSGSHSREITTSGLSAGTYLATLIYGGRSISQKVIIQ